MASLVADYASSDDEAPAAVPVARPPQPVDDADLDDDAAEQQARADVFGLKESERVMAPGTVAGRLGGAAVAHVSAAPDVLAEVSIGFSLGDACSFAVPRRSHMQLIPAAVSR